MSISVTSSQRLSPQIEKLFNSPYAAPTGRIKSFVLNPEYKTNAPSCMLRVWSEKIGLSEILKAMSHYIRKGAGVKIHFDSENPVFWKTREVSWNFYCNPDHPDIDKMPEEYRNKYKCLADWQENPKSSEDGIIIVQDNIESIESSWERFIDAAISGNPIFLDLSEIRPSGTQTTSKTISTGIFGIENTDTGFIEIYKWLCQCVEKGDIGSVLQLLNCLYKVLSRGGTSKRKSGIVTTAINWDNPIIYEYLHYPLGEIAGGTKKGIRYSPEIFENEELTDLVIEKVNSESLMLEKIKDPDLYANVCMGIFLEDKASCLVSPANAGQCKTPEELPEALCTVVELLALIHYSWRDIVNAREDLYLPANQDRQIAVGWLGWANFLRMQKVSYKDCAYAMRALRLNKIDDFMAKDDGNFRAVKIALWLKKAYEKSAEIAKKYNLERVYSIEPNQRVYLDYKDVDGFTTCRNINPPYSRTQIRASEVYGDEITEHGDVETVAEVGHDVLQLLWEEFQLLAESTRLAHAGSFDIHRKIDREWFEEFTLRSPLQTTYYQMVDSVNQEYLNKGVAVTAQCEEEICMVCGEG